MPGLNGSLDTFVFNLFINLKLANSKHLAKLKILTKPKKFYFSRKMAPKFEKSRKMAYSKSQKIGLPGQKIKI